MNMLYLPLSNQFHLSLEVEDLHAVFVSDWFNQRVQVFNSDGKFLLKFGSHESENGQSLDPRGIALGYCGQYLFVCDWGNHRIQLFNAMNGQFVKSYGS
jgi:tripartite motif-containing protein 2/3/tripartite motif-containing protein 71